MFLRIDWNPWPKKVAKFCAIFEVNNSTSAVLDFMAQFDDKYWGNYQYLKFY